jgi:hypothetical protein
VREEFRADDLARLLADADLEVFGLQVPHRPTVLVDDAHVDRDDLDARREDGALRALGWPRALVLAEQQRQEDRKGASHAFTVLLEAMRAL